MRTQSTSTRFPSLEDVQARLRPKKPAGHGVDRDAEREHSARAATAYDTRIAALADRAVSKATTLRNKAKTLRDAAAPFSIGLAKRDASHIALSLFRGPAPAGLNAFCHAVACAIDARLDQLGSSDRASVGFRDRRQSSLTIVIAPEGIAAGKASAAAAPQPASGFVRTFEGLKTKHEQHATTIRFCMQAVVERYPDRGFEAAFGYSRTDLAAITRGEKVIDDAEALTLIRTVLVAVRDQDEPIAVPGIDGARLGEAQRLIESLTNTRYPS